MAAQPGRPDNGEAPELSADDLVVTSDAPSRDHDPDPDLDKVSAQLVALIAGTIVLLGLAIGPMWTAP